MVTSRRDRLRQELTQQILDVAGQQLAVNGAGGVSWRGIAREVGMNPASLYTYFAGLDELYTELILQAFHSLADAVRAASFDARTAGAVEQLLTCAAAYRTWAVTNPARFNLIFSNQIPGYSAPENGPTRDAELAVFRPFVAAVEQITGTAWNVGDNTDLASDKQDRYLALYGLLHGLVSLEVNSHLPSGIDHGDRFEGRIRRALDLWSS